MAESLAMNHVARTVRSGTVDKRDDQAKKVGENPHRRPMDQVLGHQVICDFPYGSIVNPLLWNMCLDVRNFCLVP